MHVCVCVYLPPLNPAKVDGILRRSKEKQKKKRSRQKEGETTQIKKEAAHTQPGRGRIPDGRVHVKCL